MSRVPEINGFLFWLEMNTDVLSSLNILSISAVWRELALRGENPCELCWSVCFSHHNKRTLPRSTISSIHVELGLIDLRPHQDIRSSVFSKTLVLQCPHSKHSSFLLLPFLRPTIFHLSTSCNMLLCLSLTPLSQPLR